MDDGPAIEQLTLMAYDERVAERIRQAFGERRGITERKMFGGLSFLSRGRMCCGAVQLRRTPRSRENAIFRGSSMARDRAHTTVDHAADGDNFRDARTRSRVS
jgi:hypothetical protein